MTFDASEYTKALEGFLVNMGDFQGGKLPYDRMEAAMDPLCSFLRVAKVQIEFYASVHQEIRQIGNQSTTYQKGMPDKNEKKSYREVTEEGSVVVINIFPYEGNAVWTKEEINHVDVMARMLFVFYTRERVSRMAEELAYRDSTIGIYNYKFFMKKLDELLEREVAGRYIACYYNLKRFSIINQQVGRDIGTHIMRQFSTGLQHMLGDRGYVCRINGDNFTVVFEKQCLGSVMEYLKRTGIYYEQGSEEHVLIETTAGYYEIPGLEESLNPTDIMDRITAAYHVASTDSHSAYAFFDKPMMQEMVRKKNIENEFRNALETEEFLVYYQPKVNLKTYTLAGAEALCRWRHNVDLIPPFHFIPILEESHAICELDFYMLEHVCMDLRKWLDEGKNVVRVSVNFSRQHMGDVDLAERILQIIDSYRIPHQYLEIELTETTTDVAFTDLRKLVDKLQSQGIRTSVDDFGVGYSSLNLIRELPWDVLKIDKSFLPDTIDPTNEKYVMFKYLVAMAQNLGLECIVEGVETVNHIRVLKENQCYMAQGFYFDKPLPKDEFERRFTQKRKVD